MDEAENDVAQLVLVEGQLPILLADVEGVELAEQYEVRLELSVHGLLDERDHGFSEQFELFLAIFLLNESEILLVRPEETAKSDVDEEIR